MSDHLQRAEAVACGAGAGPTGRACGVAHRGTDAKQIALRARLTPLPAVLSASPLDVVSECGAGGFKPTISDACLSIRNRFRRTGKNMSVVRVTATAAARLQEAEHVAVVVTAEGTIEYWQVPG